MTVRTNNIWQRTALTRINRRADLHQVIRGAVRIIDRHWAGRGQGNSSNCPSGGRWNNCVFIAGMVRPLNARSWLTRKS